MVCLAASIVTKGGKPLLSRQFHPSLTRARLESLLISFVKLIPPGTQHTTFLSADNSMRFVYMPVDELYVILLTPPLSNIIQDIETLHLIGRIVSETCSTVGGRGAASEAEALRNSFELLSAFDEVVSLGYRERVGINEVRAAMEMESHEERIQDIIARNKEQEAKEELKRRAKQLEIQRKEAAKRGQSMYGQRGGMGSSMGSYDAPSFQAPTPAPLQVETDRFGGSPSRTGAGRPFKTKGMQLGSSSKGGRKQADLMDALAGEVAPLEAAVPLLNEPQHQASNPAAPAAAATSNESPFGPVDEEEVHLVIREKISLELNRDGGITSFEIKGDMDLRIASAEVAKVVLHLEHSDSFGNDLQFKTHPNVDKKAWSDGKKLGLKDPRRGFPVGQGLGVLKWRMTSKDEGLIPLSINCWPSPSDNGTCDVNIEYENESAGAVALRNLLISIPLPPGGLPTINSAEGTYAVNPETHTLDWFIENVEPNSSGSMEFNVPGDDASAFFPVAVDFAAQKSVCGVKVLTVKEAESSNPVDFSTETLLLVDDYAVI